MVMKLLSKWVGPLKLCRRWWESEIRGNCRSDKRLDGVAEPVNAYSNVVYVVSGLAAWLILGTPESAVFAAAMSFLGVGSFLYHALPSVKTAAIDHAGMYAVFLALLSGTIGAGWPLMAITAGVGAYLFRYAFSMNLNVMMGLFLWLTLLAVGLNTLAIASLACFLLAFIVWQLDIRRILTRQYGHGIWHILTAIAILLMFLA